MTRHIVQLYPRVKLRVKPVIQIILSDNLNLLDPIYQSLSLAGLFRITLVFTSIAMQPLKMMQEGVDLNRASLTFDYLSGIDCRFVLQLS